MSTKITRDYSEINALIKDIRSSSKEASKEARALNNALAVDPENFELMSQKAESLQRNVKTATDNVVRLKAQQQKYITEGGDLNSKEYKKLSLEIINAETNAKKLEKELQGVNKQLASSDPNKFAAALSGLNSKLDTAKQKLQGIAKAAQGTLLAIAGATTAFVAFADELGDTSGKMRVSVEDLQIGRGLFEHFALDAKNYDDALKALGSSMTSIAKGRGTAYLETLERIGLATEDLLGKGTAEQLDLVMTALSEITDEAERVEIAMILMGDAGRNVATVAGLSSEEINEYKNALVDAGLLTEEQVAAAGELADSMDILKKEFMANLAMIVQGLMPAILAFIDIIKNTVLPIINSWAQWMGGLSEGQLKVIVTIIGILAVLPKLIGAVQAAIKVVGLFRTALTFLAAHPIIAFIMAIVGAIMLLIEAWKSLSRLFGHNVSTPETNVQVPDLSTYQQTLMQGAEVVATQRKDIHVTADINAVGDTPIAQQNADMVADILMEEIDELLGEKL